MECEQFEEHLIDYFIEADLDWRIRQEIDEHALACDECNKKFMIASMVTDRKILKKALQSIDIGEMVAEVDSLILNENFNEAKDLLGKLWTINPGHPELLKRWWLTVKIGGEERDIFSLTEPTKIDIPIEEQVTVYRNNENIAEFELQAVFDIGLYDAEDQESDIIKTVFEDENVLVETHQGINGNFLLIVPKK